MRFSNYARERPRPPNYAGHWPPSNTKMLKTRCGAEMSPQNICNYDELPMKHKRKSLKIPPSHLSPRSLTDGYTGHRRSNDARLVQQHGASYNYKLTITHYTIYYCVLLSSDCTHRPGGAQFSLLHDALRCTLASRCTIRIPSALPRIIEGDPRRGVGAFHMQPQFCWPPQTSDAG